MPLYDIRGQLQEYTKSSIIRYEQGCKILYLNISFQKINIYLVAD